MGYSKKLIDEVFDCCGNIRAQNLTAALAYTKYIGKYKEAFCCKCLEERGIDPAKYDFSADPRVVSRMITSIPGDDGSEYVAWTDDFGYGWKDCPIFTNWKFKFKGIEDEYEVAANDWIVEADYEYSDNDLSHDEGAVCRFLDNAPFDPDDFESEEDYERKMQFWIWDEFSPVEYALSDMTAKVIQTLNQNEREIEASLKKKSPRSDLKARYEVVIDTGRSEKILFMSDDQAEAVRVADHFKSKGRYDRVVVWDNETEDEIWDDETSPVKTESIIRYGRMIRESRRRR